MKQLKLKLKLMVSVVVVVVMLTVLCWSDFRLNLSIGCRISGSPLSGQCQASFSLIAIRDRHQLFVVIVVLLALVVVVIYSKFIIVCVKDT